MIPLFVLIPNAEASQLMVNLQQLEYHIVDACNLACKFCTHYSDMKQPLNAQDLDKARAEWEPWAERVQPGRFIILGGEPTLHKQLPQFVSAALEVWKDSTIWLYTNGFKLERFTDQLLDVMNERTMLSLSLHYNDERDDEQRAKLEPFKAAGIPCQETSAGGLWVQLYQKDDSGVPVPFEHNNASASWRTCHCKHCHILRDGKLWKCPPVVYGRHLGIYERFPEFVNYKPCELGDDVARWARRTIEKCCSHCSAFPVYVPGAEGV